MKLASLLCLLGILCLTISSCSRSTPSVDLAEKVLQGNVQQNANGCIKLVSCHKTNGIERNFMGQKVYELECTAQIEFERDCYWDWDPSFRTDPSPLASGWTVQANHEIVTEPPKYVPPSVDGTLHIQPLRLHPNMFHYWHKGDVATLTGIKFGFEKTEQGWRDQNGRVY